MEWVVSNRKENRRKLSISGEEKKLATGREKRRGLVPERRGEKKKVNNRGRSSTGVSGKTYLGKKVFAARIP